jgi:alkanesulfonate monooxygenase SsuD/methylene tetrahydromethanopterin reductase-like flavin-dependent oxidoreductase (luciferase family)/predicted kinase
MHRLPDPTLVVLVGSSASGKTTWAAEHFAADQVVSSDRLRALVGEGEQDLRASADAFAVLDQVVAARLRRRLTTVVDSLGFDDARRRQWLDLAEKHGVPAVAIAFDTPAAECRRRNSARDHRVPAAVLTGQLRTYAKLRPRLAGEGYAEVLTPEPVRVVPATFAAAERNVTPPVAGPAEAERAAGLRFGLYLPAFGVPGGAAELADRLRSVAAAAEEAGFASIWVMDHLRQIPQVGRAWDDMPESLTTLGYLAAATMRVDIGCLVHGIGLRNVALLGKSVATLDVLSGGRAWCGLGLGWFEAEQKAYGIPIASRAERYALLEDALELLPLLWGKGSPAYDGRVLHVPEAMCYPRPLRGRVPILVGGSGERRTLKLAARYADACNVFGEPETVRHKVDVLRRHCLDAGRDPEEVEVTHLSTALVTRTTDELAAELARRRPRQGGGAAWATRTNPGTVEDHVLRARSLHAAGVQQEIVSLPGVWDTPAIEWFGEVIAACSAVRN